MDKRHGGPEGLGGPFPGFSVLLDGASYTYDNVGNRTAKTKSLNGITGMTASKIPRCNVNAAIGRAAKKMTGDEKQQQSGLQILHTLLTSADTVPAERIREAMESPDLECQGELFNFIMEPGNIARVAPALEFEEYQSIVSRYLTRCVIEDPPDAVACPRWVACYEFANWFRWLWLDRSIPRSAVVEAKQLMRKLYVESGPNVRKALTQGMLEHLFENPAVRDFFSDWITAEPELREAYNEASEWSQQGRHSPLWK